MLRHLHHKNSITPKKTDIKETPNKPHATGEDQEMAENYNIINFRCYDG